MEIDGENVVLDLDTTLSYELSNVQKSWSTITLDEDMIALTQVDLQTGKCNKFKEMGNNAREIIDLLFDEGSYTGKITVEDGDIVVYLFFTDLFTERIYRVLVRKWKKGVSEKDREKVLFHLHFNGEIAWSKAMECTEPIADEIL